jgi:single-stranded-DNA-specific exonuclease
VGEKHLKLTLDVEGVEIAGIAFNIDVEEWLAAPLRKMGALYRLDVNEYRGERSAQLVIQSFWPI